MRKSKLFLILTAVVLVLVLTIAFAACDKKPASDENGGSGTEQGNTEQKGNEQDNEQNGGNTVDTTPISADIAVPEWVSISDGLAKWKRDNTVSGYEMEINGVIVSMGNNVNFHLDEYAARPADGVFHLRLRALKDGKASNWSAMRDYTYEGNALRSPEVSGMVDNVLRWTSDATDAEYVSLVIGATEYKLDKTATSYDFSAVTQDSDVVLTLVGDGAYHKNSKATRLRYLAAKHKISYASPTNVHMEGEVLRFDPVEGVDTYYVCDVYNTVTTLTFDEVSELASDRKGHFLIKYMYVGNTANDDIADSEPAPVTYFTSGTGADREHAFHITNVGEMRYIEYYEATNMSCYYVLDADIDFGAYEPKKDEEYSNFYNLGSLSGTLDGNGHSLKNIVVYYRDGFSSIFDNITQTGTIKNLVIEDTNWRTWTARTNDGVMHEKGGVVAVLAYTNRGTVENVTLRSGTITAAKDGAAGLVSINRHVIRDCAIESGAVITGANEVGAIAIYNEGEITDCVNRGTVKGGNVVGGIVGRNAGTVSQCVNAGTVVGNNAVGGIVGYNYNICIDDTEMQYDTTVSYCVGALGATVTGVRYVGGLVGRNGSTGTNELGVEAYANAGVYGSYNQSNVSGAYAVGGLVGENRGYYDANLHFGVFGCYSAGAIAFASRRLIYFTKPAGWGNVLYAYAWNDADKTNEGAWPGNQCTYVGTNTTYGQEVYCAVISQSSDRIIFNEGGNKTPDIEVTASSYGFYLDGGNAIAYGDEGNFDPDKTMGYLVGINNHINYCYFARPVSGDPNVSAAASGNVDYTTVKEMNGDTVKTTIAQDLNAVLPRAAFVVVGEGYPQLDWQQEN